MTPNPPLDVFPVHTDGNRGTHRTWPREHIGNTSGTQGHIGSSGLAGMERLAQQLHRAYSIRRLGAAEAGEGSGSPGRWSADTPTSIPRLSRGVGPSRLVTPRWSWMPSSISWRRPASPTCSVEGRRLGPLGDLTVNHPKPFNGMKDGDMETPGPKAIALVEGLNLAFSFGSKDQPPRLYLFEEGEGMPLAEYDLYPHQDPRQMLNLDELVEDIGHFIDERFPELPSASPRPPRPARPNAPRSSSAPARPRPRRSSPTSSRTNRVAGSSSIVELTGWIGSRIRSYRPAGKKPATIYLEIGIRTRPGGMGVDWFKVAGYGAVATGIQKLRVRPGDKVSASGELSMRHRPLVLRSPHAYVVIQLDSLRMLCRLARRRDGGGGVGAGNGRGPRLAQGFCGEPR